MTDYKLTGGEHVIRVIDGAFIPADPANVDWRTYQAWLADGHQPEPVDPTVAQAAANAPLLLQIAELEAQQTDRLIREAMINDPAVNPLTGRTAAAQLAWINDQIKALRAKLQK